jgi:hypothetical protein
MACPRGSKKLAFNHRVAVLCYLSGMTKGAAMIEAGYSPKTPSPHVFDREDVRAEIEREQRAVTEKYEVGKDWVTEQYIKIALAAETLSKFKIVDLKTGLLAWDFRGATQHELSLIDDLTVTTTKSLAGGLKTTMKVGMPSRLSALEGLCRVHGLNKDSLDLTGGLSLVDRLQRGRKRASGKEEEDGEA